MVDVDPLPTPDEFPARPPDMLQSDLQRHQSIQEKKSIYCIVLLSITYFIFGIGVGLYGPLYPSQAYIHSVPSYIYGGVISCNFFVALLFYPVASIMVSSITCKYSILIGTLINGCCLLLFGTLNLTAKKMSFIFLSFAIQIVQGIGIAMLLVSTFIILFSENIEKMSKHTIWIMVSTVLGLSIGPICGEAANKAFGFSGPFYGIGILTILNAILLAVILTEPGQKLGYKNLRIVSWWKEPGMPIYFFVIFSTFFYTGFMTVILEPYLRQFHLHKVFSGFLFALPSLACALTAPIWKWLTKKGFNGLLLSCIASILIIASLILIVPSSFTSLNKSLTNVSISLLLQGIGSGGKLACVTYAAYRDIYTRPRTNETEVILQLIIPTMFAFGSYAGYFSGSTIVGLTLYFFGLSTSSYFLYVLEIICVILPLTYAFKRNYRSPRQILRAQENQPILGS